MTKKSAGVALAAAVVLVAAGGCWLYSAGAAKRVAEGVARALVSRDWHTLYAHTPEKDMEWNGWDEAQFSRFCGALTEGLDLGDLDRSVVELESPSIDGTVGRRAFLAFGSPADLQNTDGAVPLQVTCRRDAEGRWTVGALPVLAWYLKRAVADPQERNQRIREALVASRLTQVASYEHRQGFTLDSLDAALAGEVPAQEAAVAIHGPQPSR